MSDQMYVVTNKDHTVFIAIDHSSGGYPYTTTKPESFSGGEAAKLAQEINAGRFGDFKEYFHATQENYGSSPADSLLHSAQIALRQLLEKVAAEKPLGYNYASDTLRDIDRYFERKERP